MPEKHFFGPFSVQLKKALELNEQLRQRMGVVIVGPSGAGKSTLWRMLRAALSKTGKVVSGTSSFIHCFGLENAAYFPKMLAGVPVQLCFWIRPFMAVAQMNICCYCLLVKANYRFKKKKKKS